MTRNSVKKIVLATLAFVTAVMLALGITFTVLRPAFRTVTPAGKQYTSVQSSKQNGRVYAADASGNVLRLAGGVTVFTPLI